MFTGLIEQQGRVIANNTLSGGRQLVIDVPLLEPCTGESIAINGVCLTLTDSSRPYWAFDLSQETIERTHLGSCVVGDVVNIERALSVSARFGGHYVTGHVDTVATLQAMHRMGECMEITVGDFGLSSAHLYLIPKGSITLDGVSLTINEATDGVIKLMLIPHTLALTTFSELKPGHCFNVEFDYIARIVAHQLAVCGKVQQEDCR